MVVANGSERRGSCDICCARGAEAKTAPLPVFHLGRECHSTIAAITENYRGLSGPSLSLGCCLRSPRLQHRSSWREFDADQDIFDQVSAAADAPRGAARRAGRALASGFGLWRSGKGGGAGVVGWGVCAVWGHEPPETVTYEALKASHGLWRRPGVRRALRGLLGADAFVCGAPSTRHTHQLIAPPGRLELSRPSRPGAGRVPRASAHSNRPAALARGLEPQTCGRQPTPGASAAASRDQLRGPLAHALSRRRLAGSPARSPGTRAQSPASAAPRHAHGGRLSRSLGLL
jgi:hypothetical protein